MAFVRMWWGGLMRTLLWGLVVGFWMFEGWCEGSREEVKMGVSGLFGGRVCKEEGREEADLLSQSTH